MALVGLALGALVIWILARRRKRGEDYAVTAASPSELPSEQPKELYTDQVLIHELGSGDAGLSEMDGTGAPMEMHAMDVPARR